MIISHGMIKCFGSSLFLKNTFNMNYILDINSFLRDTKEIDQILSNLIDFKEIHKTIKREQMDQYIISYYIPQKWSNQFCKLFSQLEHLFSININNKYKSYYISSPTLEDLLSKIETDNNSYSGSCSYASSQEKIEPKFLGDNNYTNLDKMTYDNSTILNSPSYHDNNNSYNKVDISTNKNINIHDSFTDRISNYNYNIYQSNNDNSKDNSVHENTNNSINNRNNGHLYRNVLLLSLIRIKLICGNFSFIIYTVIIPLIITISIILYFNGYLYSIFDKSELGKLKFDLDIYPKSWFIEQGTDEIGNHILRNSNFSKFITSNVIDYNKSLSLTSLKNQQPNSIREIYTGGFKIIQNDKILDVTIYHNDTYLYSLPLSINMINNAIVSYYHSNYSLVTNYQPFTTNEQNDNSNTVIPYNKYLTKINTNYIKYQSLIEQYSILIFSSIFSIISVIYTPLIVKDKEDNNFHLLSLAVISQKCYWLGILLSYIVLSLNIDVQCIIIMLFSEMSIIHSKILVYSILVLCLCIFVNYFYQYSFSLLFTSYYTASNYFTIINTIMTLFINTIIFLLYYFKNIEIASAPWNIFNIIFYILSMGYPLSNFLLIFLKLSSSITLIYTKIFKSPDSFLSFQKSSEFTFLSNRFGLQDISLSKEITKSFYNFNFPSLKEIINFNSSLVYQSIALVLSLMLYIILMFLIINRKNKLLKANKNWDENERKYKNEVIKEGPIEIYQEWKRVKD
ncbi:hypothetical protein H8356DRAFT_959249 [Neocallimastix lanati (nom. inval.)]|uniref:Uncharacterized protein n=1 Tax=Neocallimastix californiae TaxID=1754190 RepID=A0A1Y2AC11_9FUNG|nr:hypothetical protein H8356DRAFT_959249 [Neocallimastix sp. JGI-2020a]ORY20014.1 hypothetical protein LY90DRAFT_517148 [Neocallimastix californiae]|eukprot:ORY20014.1 hypothetical protein LY90DRAFT_517148 [Neocallimastix californiae]